MTKTWKGKATAVAASVLAIGLGIAALAYAQTIAIPLVPSIGSADIVKIIPGGAPTAQDQYAPAPLLGSYSNTLPGGNSENALIGGDFSSNLFQDGTSVGSITTTLTYTADQWFAWSGAATTLTVTQQTGAADITAGFNASLRVNKGSGAGVVQACIGQEVATVDSLRFQGQTAEFDFHAKAGPNFSAANSNLQVSIVTGTGTDEGASKLAFAFNAGGGGSSTWTGQANAAANLLVPISTTWSRYTVVAPIPATATEIAVLICYTPVGTGVAGDWFEFTGAQLVRNASLATAAGTAGLVLPVNDLRAKSFARRSTFDEQRLQQAFYYRINESATTIIQRAMCAVSSTSLAVCQINFPVPMRVAPTMSYTAGFTLTVAAQTSAVVCTATRTSTTLTGAAASVSGVPIDCTSAAGFGGVGTAAQLYDLGTGSSTGVIKASARF